MEQSVNLMLLVLVLFCGYCAKAQDEEATDPGSDAEFPEEIYQNGTNQLDTKRAGRIDDGSTASIVDYPYIVTVQISDKSGITYAAGTIISNTHVLTTAYNLDPSQYNGGIVSVTIRAGSDFTDREGFTFPASKYESHLLYNPSPGTNDVGVVTIKGSFSGYPNVKPIVVETSLIPVTSTTPDCVMVGWGMYASGRRNLPLSRANYKLYTDAQCMSHFGGSIPATLQCAYPTNGIACSDSGSPMVCNNRLYGLIQSTCQPDIIPYIVIPAATIQKFLSPFLPVKKLFKCPCDSC